jgi:hypothetical protein
MIDCLDRSIDNSFWSAMSLIFIHMSVIQDRRDVMTNVCISDSSGWSTSSEIIGNESSLSSRKVPPYSHNLHRDRIFSFRTGDFHKRIAIVESLVGNRVYRISRRRLCRWLVFWEVALCSLVEIDRRFRRASGRDTEHSPHLVPTSKMSRSYTSSTPKRHHGV